MSQHQSVAPSMQDYFTTTLTGNVALGDTVINLAAVPTASEGFLVIDPNTQATREVIYYNSKTSSSVTCPDATQGSSRGLGGTTAQTHTSGTTVEMRNVAEYWTELQNGNANTGMQQYNKDAHTNYVVSGCVWSGDSYGGTLNASMTSGVLYINGRRLTVGAVTAHAFTASKDTYVDLLASTTDQTASVVYTEASNNAASPALAANSIRIAIIVSGAGNIAAAGSVNQGDTACVLPIASSVAYSVTDSLGNLICNRNANPTVVGYRQIVANTSTTGDTPGLNIVPAIIPTGRRVRVKAYFWILQDDTINNQWTLSIIDGSTTIQQALAKNPNVSGVVLNQSMIAEVVYNPSSGLHTYKLNTSVGGGTLTMSASSTAPAFISVELV